MSADHAHAHDNGHAHHVSPVWLYVGIFGALLVLTAVTVWIAQFDFGPLTTVIAMVVATIKASLVVLFFMHMLHDHRLNALTFIFGLIFVALFFIFTLIDVGTRGQLDPMQTHTYQEHEELRALALELEKKEAAPFEYFARSRDDVAAQPDERRSVVVAPVVEDTPADEAPAGPPPDPVLVEQGKALYTAKTCNACHSVDGSRLVGPSLKRAFGRAVELESGEKLTFDTDYFRRSVREPNAQISKGFPPAMPPLPLTDEEIAALEAYIRSL